MKTLYEFKWDCGRMGHLEGIFVAESDTVQELIDSGDEIYFGEVLGKHSEITGPLKESDLAIKSQDQDFITKLVDLFESDTISGFNPFDFYEGPEDDE